MYKRQIAVCVSDTSYAVIETKHKNGGVYVQFVPTVWFKRNVQLVVRAAAKCYFPRRLPGQTIDQHLKFVKNAKFICMTPENDDKWELMDCRVLKIAIDCIDDAMTAEKMFSDYFDTSEAELKMQQRSPQAKRVRKPKKSATKIVQPVHANQESDDSEGELVVLGCNEAISDYNEAFMRESEFNGVEETNMDEKEEAGERALEGTIVQYVVPGELAEGDAETFIEVTPIDQFVDQVELGNQPSADRCKCMDKMRNKMDYFQKRVLNELADSRRETTSSIRKLTDLVSRSLNIAMTDEEADETAEISDELSEKYEVIFPVNDKDTLYATNKRIKSETDFKTFVQLKLDKISNKDSTKTARKMLSALCTVNCMSKFTWLGTKTKDRFCDLESLIDIMAKLIEKRFPKCGAFNIIETVVKQRAKSAGEATKENDNIPQSRQQHEPTTCTPPALKDLHNPEFSDPFVTGSFDPGRLLNFY